jgi:hypothetical protein
VPSGNSATRQKPMEEPLKEVNMQKQLNITTNRLQKIPVITNCDSKFQNTLSAHSNDSGVLLLP